MKVGMIFECGPKGADRKVCVRLAKLLDSSLRILVRTAGNKPLLERDCGELASQLFDRGCERVIIVWDLYPSWTSENPCRKQDCEAIFSSLNDAGVDQSKVALVCIEKELETWLLADERAIERTLSKPHRRARIGRRRNVEQIRNPKSALREVFRQLGGMDYNDYYHAELIARQITDFQRLKRIETFRRFALKVADVTL